MGFKLFPPSFTTISDEFESYPLQGQGFSREEAQKLEYILNRQKWGYLGAVASGFLGVALLRRFKYQHVVPIFRNWAKNSNNTLALRFLERGYSVGQ